MAVEKFAVVSALEEIARYLELSEENRFKTIAYQRAARALHTVGGDLEEMLASGELLKLPGIGKATAGVIEDIVRNGRSRYLDELRSQYPPGIFELLRVPSLGLRKISQLHSELGISSLEDLRAACAAGKLRGLAGFGAKTEQNICQSLDRLDQSPDRLLLPKALDLAERLVAAVRGVPGVQRAEIAGSIRRRLETVGDVDLCVAAAKPSAVIDGILARNLLAEVRQPDDRSIRGLAMNGTPVDLYVTTPRDFERMLFQATGSEAFVQAVSERTKAPLPRNRKSTEQAIFANASLPPLPPELREELQVPKKAGRAPKLIDVADIQGTFHVHSTWSDGRAPMRDMVAAAEERGFAYVGLSDHSKTAAYAGGLTESRLREQHAEIDSLRGSHPKLRIFRGSEVDILSDGSLDYDDATLASLDFVVASVHSRFKMDRDQMTERMVAAVRNPFTTFLGHLTGRLLLSREGYTLDFDRVFEEAGKHAVIIEINGNPHRLDLDWRRMRRALDFGAVFCINPDAHSVAEMEYVATGVWHARKGGLEPRHVFNTLPLEAVEEYLDARCRRAMKLKGVIPDARR